jgi:ribosomal protein S12 methylthiotransferase accessory factor
MRVEVVFDSEGRYAIEYKGGTIVPGPGPLPAPPVLFLGSLAACAGIFAVDYLRTRGLLYTGLRVTAEAGHAEGPRRLADIHVRVWLPAAVEERHMAPLRRAVELCTLKNTLAQPPTVVTEVTPPVPAGIIRE